MAKKEADNDENEPKSTTLAELGSFSAGEEGRKPIFVSITTYDNDEPKVHLTRRSERKSAARSGEIRIQPIGRLTQAEVEALVVFLGGLDLNEAFKVAKKAYKELQK